MALSGGSTRLAGAGFSACLLSRELRIPLRFGVCRANRKDLRIKPEVRQLSEAGREQGA